MKGSQEENRRVRCRGAGTIVSLTILLALASVFRFKDLGRQGLWVDEGATAFVTARPMTEYADLMRRDTAPPLFFYLVRPFARLFPHREAALRWPSAAAGVLAVGLVYFLARDLLNSYAAAWLAAALLATNRFHILRCQDARNYSLFFTLSLLAAIFLTRLEDAKARSSAGRRAGLWAGFILSGVGMVYTHNVAWFFLAGLLVSYLLAIGLIQPGRPGRWAAALGEAALAGLAIVLLFVPWLRVFLVQMMDVAGDYWTPLPGARRLAGHFATMIYRFPHVPPDYRAGFPLQLAAGLGTVLLVAVAILSVWGWVVLLKSRRYPRAVALLAGLGLGTGAIVLWSWIKTPVFMDKVVIPFLVVFQLGPAALWCAGDGPCLRVVRWALAGLVGLSLAVAVANHGLYVNEQWREAARFVVSQADPARDAILVDERFHLLALAWYLADSPYGQWSWDSTVPTLLSPGWSCAETQQVVSLWRPTVDPDSVVRAIEDRRAVLRRIWLLERTYQGDRVEERIGRHLEAISTGRQVRAFHHVRVTRYDLSAPAPDGPLWKP